MANLAVLERNTVLSFDRQSFEEVCAELMRKTKRDGLPDLIVSIPTGGAFVAEAMVKVADRTVPVLPITCRRPSSRLKPGAGAVKRMIASLPRPALDRLRALEHAILTRNAATPPSAPYRFIEEELSGFDAWVRSAPRAASILIVDDAVDSGATLMQVVEQVRRRVPPDATVRSAAITVTTTRPLAMPDYSLFYRQLCRFPWALDAG